MKIGKGLLAVVSILHTVATAVTSGVKSTAHVVADYAEAEVMHAFAKKTNKADTLRGKANAVARSMKEHANKLDVTAETEMAKGLTELDTLRDKIGLK